MHKPLLVTDFLDRARRHYGDEEAIVATTGERYTYAEFGDRVDRFSAALRDRGIEKGDRVAVLDPNTHYHLEAAYGIMQIGAVHTPLNYRLTPEDFEYILSDAEVDAIYADHEYVDRIDPIRDDVPTEIFVTNDAAAVDGEGGSDASTGGTSSDWEDFDTVIDAVEPDVERPEMSEDEVITINYTSGTTGDPKGVMRTHRCETIHAYLISIHQRIRDDDVYLWTLPMFHANGWGHIYAITGMGATHLCTRGIDAESIFETVVAEDVTYCCCAPTVLNRLINYYEDEHPQTVGDRDVRVATAGSAPPEATIRTVEDDFGWYLTHVYGATETGPLITTSDARRHFEDDSADRFAIKKRQGLGYLGTDVRVVDDEGEDVPADDESIGEVVVSGNQVMEGYWNKPEATEEAFSARAEGYYHTGDLATVDENGMIAIQDRKKDIIITGGENVSSLELEDALYDHESVSSVAVVPAPSEEWGETPKAFVVPADAADPGAALEDELIAFTKDRLASFKAITSVEFVEDLPTTATGKVQKYELRASLWEGEERMVGEG